MMSDFSSSFVKIRAYGAGHRLGYPKNRDGSAGGGQHRPYPVSLIRRKNNRCKSRRLL